MVVLMLVMMVSGGVMLGGIASSTWHVNALSRNLTLINKLV